MCLCDMTETLALHITTCRLLLLKVWMPLSNFIGILAQLVEFINYNEHFTFLSTGCWWMLFCLNLQRFVKQIQNTSSFHETVAVPFVTDGVLNIFCSLYCFVISMMIFEQEIRVTSVRQGWFWMLMVVDTAEVRTLCIN